MRCWLLTQAKSQFTSRATKLNCIRNPAVSTPHPTFTHRLNVCWGMRPSVMLSFREPTQPCSYLWECQVKLNFHYNSNSRAVVRNSVAVSWFKTVHEQINLIKFLTPTVLILFVSDYDSIEISQPHPSGLVLNHTTATSISRCMGVTELKTLWLCLIWKCRKYFTLLPQGSIGFATNMTAVKHTRTWHCWPELN